MAALISIVLARYFCNKITIFNPSVKVFGLEGRYAGALYTAASKTDQLHQVERDLITFQETFKSDPILCEKVANPIVKRIIKKAIEDASAKFGFATSTSNILQTMAENGHLEKIDSLICCFRMIMAEHRGDAIFKVVTAKPLDVEPAKQMKPDHAGPEDRTE